MWLVCKVLGHNWFDTVITETTIEGTPWGWGHMERTKFRERFCLRCKKPEAVYLKTLATFDPERLWAARQTNVDQPLDPPAWLSEPTSFHPLPGDWSG